MVKFLLPPAVCLHVCVPSSCFSDVAAAAVMLGYACLLTSLASRLQLATMTEQKKVTTANLCVCACVHLHMYVSVTDGSG